MKNDPPRLLTDIVGALIDRAPIEWRALERRVRAPVDAKVVENLHTLETIRADVIHARSPTRSIRGLVALAIVTLAMTQVIGGVLFLLWTIGRGFAFNQRLPQIALAIAFAGAALLLGARRTRDGRRLFLLTTFMIVASTFVRGTIRAVTASAEDSGTLMWAVLMRGSSLEVFLPACVWQFALDFPAVHRFTWFERVASRTATVFWVIGVVALALSVSGTIDTTDSAVWHLITVSVVPAVGAIFIRSRRAPYLERMKVARFALALVAGGVPFLALGLARAIWPTFNLWFVHASGRERAWLDTLIVSGLVASPLLSTAAILVDRPFEISSRMWTRYLSAFRSRAFQTRPPQERVAVAVSRVSLACGSRETVMVLERELRSDLDATRVRVMEPALDRGFHDRSADVSPIVPSMALHGVVSHSTALVDLSSDAALLDLLPAGDREWVFSNHVELIASIRRRTGEVAALAVVGPKRGGQPYERGDRTLLVAIIAAAGLAWDADRTGEQRPAIDQPAYECETCGRVSEQQHRSCTCDGDLVVAALPQRLAAKFVVERRIGRGGAGVVYLARDVTIGREVALKTLPTLRRGVATRLADEARTMASLRHDGLATIFGLEIWRDIPILVVEYFPAGTLAHRLAAGPLSATDAIDLGIALADTLSYLHGRGLLHRDLKPSNIALSAGGRPVLLDFGLAIWLESRGDRATAGTPAYLPPEAFHGAPASPAFDLWSLATVVLECVSGVHPRAGHPDPSDTLRPIYEKTPALANTLERALAADVRARFPTADTFRAALQTAR
jgi:hypothetical protein